MSLRQTRSSRNKVFDSSVDYMEKSHPRNMHRKIECEDCGVLIKEKDIERHYERECTGI